MSSDDLLTVTAVAETLGVSARHVRRLIVSGALPVVRLGGKIRVRADDVDRHLSPDWMTAQQAADELGVSVSTVWSMARRGDIDAERVGRSWRIHSLYGPSDGGDAA